MTLALNNKPTNSDHLSQAKVNSAKDNRINALLTGTQWGVNTISYSFYDDNVRNTYYGDEKASEVSNGIKKNIRTIFKDYIEPFINLKFVEVKDTRNNYGLIRYQLHQGSEYAYAYEPYSTDSNQGNGNDIAGDVHLSSRDDVNNGRGGFQSGFGTYGFSTLLHETLHAIGLKHPGDYNGDGFGQPPFLPAREDNSTNTVMTYNDSGSSIGAITPMTYDIRALQYLYGTKKHNADNTRYIFDSVYSFADDKRSWGNKSTRAKLTLWDSNGLDTLDFSKLSSQDSGYRFDLREGGVLTTQQAYNQETYRTEGDKKDKTTYRTTAYGTSLAYNMTIENVVASSSDDLIILNKAANTIGGYGPGIKVGKDTIRGGNNLDTLDLSGYKAADITLKDQGKDRVIELGANGSVTLEDYLSSSENNRLKVLFGDRTPPVPDANGVNKTGTAGNDTLAGTERNDSLSGLGGNDVLKARGGDDLLKGGSGLDVLDGGAGNDRLFAGNGNDTLIGGTGADTLKGGAGSDVFTYFEIAEGNDTILDFQNGRDKIDVSRLVEGSHFTSSNIEEYLEFTQLGSSAAVKFDVLGDKGNQFEMLATLSNFNINQLSARDFVS